MIVQSPPLGQLGILPDQPVNNLPVGSWLFARNMRFDDGHVKRIKGPSEFLATVGGDGGTWMQVYDDALGPRIIYGTADSLYRLNVAGDAWEDVTRLSGPYTGGDWHSFEWGDSVIFNNGVDVPQILVSGTNNFVDLPNWGLTTSGQKAVTALSLRPFGDFLVACNITVDAVRKPNMVWWSAPGVLDNNDSNFNSPSWDYEDPGTLSGFNYVGVSDGELVDSLTLDTSHMLYTRTAAHAMDFVGGTFVFNFRRVLDYGLVQLGALAEFNNYHFVVAPSTLYIHDGSTVRHVADGRVEDYFFDNLQGPDTVRCTQDVETKEIHTLFLDGSDNKLYMIYNYDDDNWSTGDARYDGTDVVCMAYGLEAQEDVVTWDNVTTTWDTDANRWQDYALQNNKRRMYWLTPDALLKAEDLEVKEPDKAYVLLSGRWDFSELGQNMSVGDINHIRRLIPQITGTIGPAPAEFKLQYAQNLSSTVSPQKIYPFDPLTQYKIDTRISGRYLIMQVDITGNGEWEMTGMDYDLEVVHGR